MFPLQRQSFDRLPFTLIDGQAARHLIMSRNISFVCAAISGAIFLYILRDYIWPDLSQFDIDNDRADMVRGRVLPILVLSAVCVVLFAAFPSCSWPWARQSGASIKSTAQRPSVLTVNESLCGASRSRITITFDGGEMFYRGGAGYGAFGTTQTLDLVHKNPAYRINFLETESLSYASSCCRAWAEGLDLPIVRETTYGLPPLRPDAYDQSLLAQAKKDQIKTTIDLEKERPTASSRKNRATTGQPGSARIFILDPARS